jgi:ABC-type Mn2+/Zn2+ transport system permease subunit/ABC-type Mn2+/Zn2+ transport system ATPase subunit
MDNTLIQLNNCGILRNRKWLVRGVSLTVDRGQIVTLIGPNGSGKSTTAKMALGIMKPDEGDNTIKENLKISYVPQKLVIDWSLPLRVLDFMNLIENYEYSIINEMLTITGIQHLQNEDVRNLSGGEFQRLLMARAIAKKPDFLVLDEPVQGVDYAGEIALYQIIQDIRKNLNCGILLISHNLHVVMSQTNHVICLNGHICCSGEPKSIVKNPEYIKLFGENMDPTLAFYKHEHDHHHHPDGSVDHSINYMFEDFLFRAFVAGIGLALIAGPLGCFIVWRRLSYFGDTLAHSALLGVVIGYALNLNFIISVFVISALISLSLLYLQKRTTLPNDALLGLLAHSVLSIGLVLLGVLSFIRIDLMSLLFGDILAVNVQDLIIVWAGGGLSLLVLIYIWRPLFAGTVNLELAKAEGLNPELANTIFTLLIALVIAISIKIVGILLITGLLIIPAAASRNLSSHPIQMAVVSSLLGVLAVITGLLSSINWDTSTGPTILSAALGIFILTLFPWKKLPIFEKKNRLVK